MLPNICLRLLFVLLLAAPAYADDIRFGIMQQHPYGYFEDEGPKGYLYDIAHAVLDKAGFVGKLEILPHKRLQVELKSGIQQCTFFAESSYALENFQAHEPIGKVLAAVILPRAGVFLKTYDDLRGIRIGVPRGVFIDPRFDADETLNKQETLDYHHSMRMLRHQRLDAVVGGYDSLLFNMKETGIPLSAISDPLVFHKLEIALFCGKESLTGREADRLNKAIVELRENGTIRHIIAGYLGK